MPDPDFTGSMDRRKCLQLLGLVPAAVTVPLLLPGTANAGTRVSARAFSKAVSQPVVPVVNTEGGVYWRVEPTWDRAIPEDGEGLYDGDRVRLWQFIWGGTVPPLWNNRLWYWAEIVSDLRGRVITTGFVNDHFLDTGSSQPNQVLPGVPEAEPPPDSGLTEG
jgi:hypothetical protein